MSDRFQELLRQRALVQQHLAWLDGEIAEASGSTPATPTPAPRQPFSSPHPTPPAPSYAASQAAAITRHASTTPPARFDENPNVNAAADANPRRVSRSLLLCRVRVGAAERQAVRCSA